MRKIEEHSYQLKVYSTLILSPRESKAFYPAEKDFSDYGDDKKPKIIYPFYQYGTYEKYRPQNTQYYIPGSSIKGVLLAKHQKKKSCQRSKENLMIDDISLKSEDLVLKNLFKVQHMVSRTGEKMSVEKFFPNIKIEMLNFNENRKYDGVIFCEESPKGYFKEAEERTISLLKQLCKRIEDCSGLDKTEDCTTILANLLNNIKKILEEVNCKDKNTYILILGGYKGLLLSGEFQNVKDDYQSAIYIDKERNLPHGLVQITI